MDVKLVVFDDRIELKCQIPVETDKSANVIMTLGLKQISEHSLGQ